MGPQIIDVDQHLFESRGTWTEHIEPAWRDDALRIEDDEAGWPWLMWRDRQLTPIEVPIPERSSLIGDDRLRRLRGERAAASFEDLVPPSYGTVAPRLASLDEFGIDAAVLFPNYGLLWEQMLASDRPAQRANARAYNRFMAETCGEGEGRLFGVAHLLLHDPEWATEEIARIRAEGVRLAMIAPAPVDGKPLSHPDFDPVWAAFSTHGVAPVFHVSGFESPIHPAWREGEDEQGEQLFDSIFLWLAPAVALANLILHGVLERFPDLRIGVIEQGAIWVPSWLRQMESAFEAFHRHEDRLQALSLRPTDYVHRQVRFTPYPTEDVGWIVEQAGPDLVMFSSDYPHVEGGRKPVERFEASLGGAGEDVRQQFYVDNFLFLMGAAGSRLAA